MTWTAVRLSQTRTRGDLRRVRVQVQYMNDASPPLSETVAHDVASEAQLQATVTARLVQYAQADATLAALAAQELGPITPNPVPTDPNAGLATLTVVGFLGLLSEASTAKLRTLGYLDAIRGDVLRQDRPAIMGWIGVMAAQAVANDPTTSIITAAEATALTAALSAPAQPTS